MRLLRKFLRARFGGMGTEESSGNLTSYFLTFLATRYTCDFLSPLLSENSISFVYEYGHVLQPGLDNVGTTMKISNKNLKDVGFLMAGLAEMLLLVLWGAAPLPCSWPGWDGLRTPLLHPVQRWDA